MDFELTGRFGQGGVPDMVVWTGKQPDRVYQMSIAGESIAVFLRVKAGTTKAGRGRYTPRPPVNL